MEKTLTAIPLVVSDAQVSRDMDRLAAEEWGITPVLLMEDAAQAVLRLLDRKGFLAPPWHFLIFCGKGNNGGDGLALATLLVVRGYLVEVVLAGSPEEGSLCAQQLKRALKSGARVTPGEDFLERGDGKDCNRIVLDALLGTGLSRKPDGLYPRLIEWINHNAQTCVSLDIPSGLNADSGNVPGACVKADLTLGFGIAKKGYFLNQGPDLTGDLFYSPLSFPEELRTCFDRGRVNLPLSLVNRLRSGHKGTFGRVTVVGGSEGYRGAPGLAAYSALRCGAGLSQVVCPQSVIAGLAALWPELVFVPFPEPEHTEDPDNTEHVLEHLSRSRVVVFGPGLSTGKQAVSLMLKWFPALTGPVVLDGDALTILADNPEILKGRGSPVVLTPHPGEMSRLLGITVPEVEADRPEALKMAVQRYHCPVVLKGHRTLIGFPSGETFWNLTGSSGMATAGSGDLLSGMIAGLAAVGNPWENAIRAAVFLHGLAGEAAAGIRGEDGVTARDILAAIPSVIRDFRRGMVRDMMGIL